MNTGWDIKPICEIAKVTSSKRIFLSDYVETGIPFWRSKEVIEQYDGKNISTELFIAADKYEEIKNKFGVPQPGDILLTSVGTIGVPYLVKDDSPFYFKDGNLTWIKDISREIEPYYLT
jgi:type I restriction enzyme S subunit